MPPAPDVKACEGRNAPSLPSFAAAEPRSQPSLPDRPLVGAMRPHRRLQVNPQLNAVPQAPSRVVPLPQGREGSAADRSAVPPSESTSHQRRADEEVTPNNRILADELSQNHRRLGRGELPASLPAAGTSTPQSHFRRTSQTPQQQQQQLCSTAELPPKAESLPRDISNYSNISTSSADAVPGPVTLQPLQNSLARKLSIVGAASDALVGFNNLGNTCFMNATLQCLLRLAPLQQRLLLRSDSELYGGRDRPTPLTSATRALFQEVLASSRGRGGPSAVSPTAFKRTLAIRRREFAGSNQHDAQEFLRFALDTISQELNRVVRIPKYSELKDIEGEHPQACAERWLANYRSRNDSAIEDVFEGQLHSCTVCDACHYATMSFDVFLDVSLPIPSQPLSSSAQAQGKSRVSVLDITDLLRAFTATTVLARDSDFRCSRCKQKGSATSTMRFYRLPEVLVLHLKRFGHAGSLRQKVGDLVTFPMESLSMQPYMSSASGEQSTTYALTGVVNHRGTCSGGHYTAYCRGPAASSCVSSEPPWAEYNDSMVDAVSAAQVVSQSAYLLFYTKRRSHKL